MVVAGCPTTILHNDTLLMCVDSPLSTCPSGGWYVGTKQEGGCLEGVELLGE